jgi:hypothetical protein
MQWPLVAILAAATLLVLMTTAAFMLWQVEPSFWRQARDELAGQPAHVQQQAAIELERRLVSTIASTPRPVDLTVPLPAANAWLKTRLHVWVRHRNGSATADPADPLPIEDAAFAIERGRVIAAFRLRSDVGRQVYSLHFQTYETDEDQPLRIRLARVQAGRLVVPLALVRARLQPTLRSLRPDHADFLRAALTGQDFDPFDPAQRGTSGQPWRLLDVKVRDDHVDLELDAAAP